MMWRWPSRTHGKEVLSAFPISGMRRTVLEWVARLKVALASKLRCVLLLWIHAIILESLSALSASPLLHYVSYLGLQPL